MKLVVQRVTEASVVIDTQAVATIKQGLVVLVGIKRGDKVEHVDSMVDKILHLRVFNDEDKRMNFNIQDIKGDILVVSQFTLYGCCRKGRRPSYDQAEKPAQANVLYRLFVDRLTDRYAQVKEGVFGGDMRLSLCNDGPVTLLLTTD